MSGKQLRSIANKTIERQQDESDCGVAALSTIIQFHGGYVPLETLRALSGTTTGGTTMLGLLQAGHEIGLDTEAYEGTVEDLKSIATPTLLHVVKHEYIEHYVVCFGFDRGKFLIGDPEDGVKSVAQDELEKMWRSKALLTFSKTSRLQERKKITGEKYRWLFQALAKDRGFLVSTLLIGVLVSVLNFSTAIFTEKLVDNLVPSKDPQKIALGLCAWILLMMIKSAFGYFREQLLIQQSFRLNVRLTSDFIFRLIGLPKSFFDSRKKGDLIARLFDTSRIQNSVSSMISQDLIDVLTLVSAILVVLFYSSSIALFLSLLIPAYFLIVRNFHTRVYATNRQLMASYARNEAAYIDTLSGIEVIKQSNKQVSEAESLAQNFKKFQSDVVAVEQNTANFKFSTDLFGLLSVSFILTYSITQVLTNAIQLGDMLAVFSISSLALASTNRLAYAITHLEEARAALDRTYDVLTNRPEKTDGLEINTLDEIQIRNVTFGFAGQQPLFEELNFSIKRGEITLLLGENGSGKSTLLQLLQKFYQKQSGEILVAGKQLEEISSTSLRDQIGVVPQHVKIFNQSIKYNICLDNNAPDEQVMDFCEKWGFADFVDSFYDGIHTVLGEEGVKLSGGQRQLIALARALYRHPKFLLLDEFTAAMDKHTKAFSLGILLEKKSEMGILLITHDPSLITLATARYQLMDGRLTPA